MARGIYVSAMTPGSGKSLISLGLADMLGRHLQLVTEQMELSVRFIL